MRAINAIVRKLKLIQIKGTKNKINRSVKKDVSIKEVIESVTLDRIEWRKRMHVLDFD